MKVIYRFLVATLLVAGVAAGFTACEEGGNGGNGDEGGTGGLCALNGIWSGRQAGELITEFPSAGPTYTQTFPLDVPFAFRVENCKIPTNIASMDIEGNTVTISLSVNNETYGEQEYYFTGTLNGAKDRIAGTWTMSASYFISGVASEQSGSGTFEVSRR